MSGDVRGSFFVRRARVVGLVLLGITLMALLGLARLEFDDAPQGIFRSGDAEFERLQQVFLDFGQDDLDCLCLLESESSWFDPEHATLLRALTARMEAEPGVAAVAALDRIPVFSAGLLPRPLLPRAGAPSAEWAAAAELAREHPLVAGQLLSEDERAALVVVRLVDGTDSVGDLRPIVRGLRQSMQEVIGDAPVRGRLTGLPPIRVEIFDVVQSDNILLLVLGSVVGALVAYLMLLNLRALFAAITPALLAALWCLGCVYWLGQRLNILSVVLPTMVFVIALTDAIHLVLVMRDMRAAGSSAEEAAAQATERLTLPCLLTSLTTAIGFGSLCVSRMEMVRGLGAAAACSVGLSFLAVLYLTPRLARGASSLGRSRGGPAERAGALAARVAVAAMRRPRRVVLLGFLAMALMGAFGLQLKPDNRLTEATPRGRDSFSALRVIDERFGGSSSAGVQVEWEGDRESDDPELLAALEDVTAALSRTHPFSGALSWAGVLSVVPEGVPGRAAVVESFAPELARRFIRADLGRALVRARLPDMASSEAEEAAQRVEAELARLSKVHPEFRMHLTGTIIVARRNIDDMILDLSEGLAAAAAIIVLAIALAMRSVRLGLLSLLPNVFPLVACAALLFLSGSTLQVASAVSFTIILAVAVDDTIHVLSAYRLFLAEGLTPRGAAEEAVREVGSAMFVTTAVLVAGFGVLYASEVPTNQTVALVCCMGFLAALVGDLLLLPAALVAWEERRR